MTTTTVPLHDGPAPRARHAFPAVGLLSVIAFALLVQLSVRALTDPALAGDELRYFEQAANLASGERMYADDIVKNPPVFPALLSVLLRIGVQAEDLAYLSIVMMALAAGLVFLILHRFTSARVAGLLACAFTLYPPHLLLGSRIMTEPLCALLLLAVCLLMYDMRPGRTRALPASIAIIVLLASVALTKPVFAYAFVVAIVVLLALAAVATPAVRRFRLQLCLLLALALVACTPYLAFTHKLTGGFFSWVTSDGVHFHWMTVGGEDVWGSWRPASEARDHEVLIASGAADEIETAAGMAPGPGAAYLRERALERIGANPEIYLRNLVANTARLLFNTPFSFRPQSLTTHGYTVPNVILYTTLLVFLALLPVTWRHQNRGLFAVAVLGLVYLCGNVPVASAARQGVVLFGPFLVWIAYQWHILLTLGMVRPQGDLPDERGQGERRGER